ncbi:hypothetical protein ACLG6S_11580 [Thermodesulfobacteriota bacterium B35]
MKGIASIEPKDTVPMLAMRGFQMNRVWWIFAVVLGLLLIAGEASGAVFVRGKVTRAPWKDGKTFIVVDDVRYTIMPRVKVMLKQHRISATGAKSPGKQLYRIRPGANVWISVEGNRIYQIWEVK